MRVVVVLAWINVPFAGAMAFVAGNDVVFVAAATALLSALVMFATRVFGEDVGRSVALLGLLGQAAMIVAAMANHAWQIDAHMYFFALLAVGVLLIDSRAIIAATALVAVHHLLLNFAAAELVYPSGSDLARTVMHAVILLIEAGALLFAIQLVRQALSQARSSKQQAELELKNANEARVRADKAEQEAAEQRKQMMADLESALGDAISAAEKGDFSKRARADYDAAELNQLAGAVNRLIEKVDETVVSAVDAMEQLASGDLQAKMEGAHRGRFADLQNGINDTTHSLSTLVLDIRQMAETMQVETSRVASSASEQASRAESQAATLEETAATLEEMTATIKSNAENAVRGQESATSTSERAERGGEVVRQAVSAMGEIEKSSAKISDIISVIDGIAFQTNLLALNAAVEAARAGDAGKGFAVVASEVRALAQRSAEAARDIKALIAESSQQVGSGVSLVNRAGDALQEIVDAVAGVSETVSDISSATREQSAAIDEINTSVSHLDQMTQQNSSMTSEAASGASTLAQQGAKLASLVANFKVRTEAEQAGEAA